MELRPERRLTRSATRKKTDLHLTTPNEPLRKSARMSSRKASATQGRRKVSDSNVHASPELTKSTTARRPSTKTKAATLPEASIPLRKQTLEIPVQVEIVAPTQLSCRRSPRRSTPSLSTFDKLPLASKKSAPSRLPVAASGPLSKSSRKVKSSTTVEAPNIQISDITDDHPMVQPANDAQMAPQLSLSNNMETLCDERIVHVPSNSENLHKHSFQIRFTEPEESFEEMPLEGIKKKRKSKRRSSFVRGRISRVHLTTTSSDLCKNIPSHIPPDERLAQLGLDVLEFTLNKMTEEFPDLADMQQFQVAAREAVGKKFEDMKQNGTLKKATQKERNTPNPINLVLEASIAKAQEHINRYDAEAAMWDEIVQNKSRLTEEAERDYAKVSEMSILKQPKSLTVEQKALLDNHPNLGSVQDQVHEAKQEIHLVTEELKKSVKLVRNYQETTKTVISEQTQLLQTQSFHDIPCFGQPHILMKNLLDSQPC